MLNFCWNLMFKKTGYVTTRRLLNVNVRVWYFSALRWVIRKFLWSSVDNPAGPWELLNCSEYQPCRGNKVADSYLAIVLSSESILQAFFKKLLSLIKGEPEAIFLEKKFFVINQSNRKRSKEKKKGPIPKNVFKEIKCILWKKNKLPLK